MNEFLPKLFQSPLITFDLNEPCVSYHYLNEDNSQGHIFQT